MSSRCATATPGEFLPHVHSLGTRASPAPRLLDVLQQRDSRELRVAVAFSALLAAVVASSQIDSYSDRNWRNRLTY